MANIPVHPARKGIPWWVWLLLALAIATVAALLLLGREEEDTVRTEADSTRVVTPAPARDAVVLSLDDVPADDVDAASVAGRRVELDAAQVGRVVGDSAFTVRSDAGREVMVVLDGPIRTMVGDAVAAGDLVQVRGALRRAGERMAGVPRSARSALRPGALYIAAAATDVMASRESASGSLEDPGLDDLAPEGDPAPLPEESTLDPAPAPPPADSTLLTDTTTTR